MKILRPPRRLALITLAILFLISSLAAQPVARKLEPPNWWVGLPHDPMLMVTGENLAGVTARTHYLGVSITRAEASENGHYLFLRLKLSTAARPGTAEIELAGKSGSTVVHFPLLARQSTAGRFRGITPDDAIYLIMPDRFADGDPSNDDPPSAPGQYDRANAHRWHGGDLKGVTNHLPYLKDLGVTALWLTPWWKQAGTSSDYHGYATVDLYAVEDHLGTMRDLQEMVAAAHKAGLKVVMDYVVNHVGPKHPWAQDPPTPTWLHGTPADHPKENYEFAPLLDLHATPEQQRPVLEGWFANVLPDLNPEDPKLEHYLADNAIWWTEMTGLDAIRLDTFPYSPRRFWQKWHHELFWVYPNFFTIGEVTHIDPVVTSFFDGGRVRFDGVDSGVSTVFDFPLENVIKEVVLKGAPAKALVALLGEDELYEHPDMLVTLIGNHDQRRFMNEPGATLEKMKAAIALQLTLRGIPQLYAGDEIAMPGGNDPDNRRDFPGGWPGDARNAFTATGRTPAEQEMFAHVQALLKLRHEHPALRGGPLYHLEVSEHTYAFVRDSGNAGPERIVVDYNGGEISQQVSLLLKGTPIETAGHVTVLYGSGRAALLDGRLDLNVPPMTVLIVSVLP